MSWPMRSEGTRPEHFVRKSLTVTIWGTTIGPSPIARADSAKRFLKKAIERLFGNMKQVLLTALPAVAR